MKGKPRPCIHVLLEGPGVRFGTVCGFDLCPEWPEGENFPPRVVLPGLSVGANFGRPKSDCELLGTCHAMVTKTV